MEFGESPPIRKRQNGTEHGQAKTRTSGILETLEKTSRILETASELLVL